MSGAQQRHTPLLKRSVQKQNGAVSSNIPSEIAERLGVDEDSYVGWDWDDETGRAVVVPVDD